MLNFICEISHGFTPDLMLRGKFWFVFKGFDGKLDGSFDFLCAPGVSGVSGK